MRVAKRVSRITAAKTNSSSKDILSVDESALPLPVDAADFPGPDPAAADTEGVLPINGDDAGDFTEDRGLFFQSQGLVLLPRVGDRGGRTKQV